MKILYIYKEHGPYEKHCASLSNNIVLLNEKEFGKIISLRITDLSYVEIPLEYKIVKISNKLYEMLYSKDKITRQMVCEIINTL